MLRLAALAILLLASVVVSPASAAGQAEQQLYFVERESERRATGVLDEGETRAYSFAVAEPNLTRVDFLLTWTETGDKLLLSSPDAFALSVIGPEGRADSRGPDAGGRLHVRVPVNAAPPTQTVPLRESAARIASLTSHEGTGEWVARVRLADVGNPAALAPVDEGNAFELLVVLTSYEVVPARVVPQVGTASGAAAVWSPWSAAAGVLALLVAVGGVLLARGNTSSPRGGQREALPPGDESPYILTRRE